MKEIDKSKIKTWFVTGASSGVGWELCRQLLKENYNVIAVSRRVPKFRHKNCICLSVDVTNSASISEAIKKGVDIFGRIDVLVNNAGISSNATLEEESLSHMKLVMDTNFFGTFNVIHEFLPYFRKNKNGTIINNTSQSGISYRAGGSAYCSSKHALEGLTSVCWHETASFCRVMAVELGWFPGTSIVSQMKEWDQSSQIDEYKNISSSHIKHSKFLFNDLEVAISTLIKIVEEEKLPRRLILGRDAWEQIYGEYNSLKETLLKHKKEAFKCSFKKLHNKHYGEKYVNKNKICILNFHWENVNFGALITSYALNKYLNNIGYEAYNIDYIPSFPWIPEEPQNTYFDDFRKQNMLFTRKFHSGESLDELNSEFSTFIVGSDQVWRYEFIKNDVDAYFFSFADNEKKLISYASSFGVEKINADEGELENYKLLISRFDNVGVREDSGVGICNEIGVKASKVCDPVFLLEYYDWSELAENGKCISNTDEIVYYTINENIEKDILELIKNNKNSLNYKSIKNISYNTKVEEWLYRIKNCKFFITDSFHGSCFAIIFNKPFVCVNSNEKTSTRMESIFCELEIKNRLYSNFNSVNLKELIENPIDYDIVNSKINLMKKIGQEFLLQSINSNNDRVYEKERLKAEYLKNLYTEALSKKNTVLLKYLKYKVLRKICFTKKRNIYKNKYQYYRFNYKKIKRILLENRYES